MPRAHLSKRLSDAEAIRLFAEYHIAQVRRRRNGEIVAVKHVQFGWISKERYYQLQKLHDLMPLVQEFIRGGYQAKAWLWGANFSVSIAGVSVPLPFGAGLMFTETLNLAEELNREPKDWQMLLIRAYALLGPFGDIIQIIDFIRSIPNAYAAGGEALLSPIGWLYDAINGPGSWGKQIAAAHDQSGCGQAYLNTLHWKKLAVNYTGGDATTLSQYEGLADEWYRKGKSLGCAWANVNSWRDVV